MVARIHPPRTSGALPPERTRRPPAPFALVSALLAALALGACTTAGHSPPPPAPVALARPASLSTSAPAHAAPSPGTPRPTTPPPALLLPAASPPSRPHLALGDLFSCLLLASGEVRCWGDNEAGQLGDPSAPGGHTPRRVPLPRPAYGLSAFERTACALLNDGTSACWGQGLGPAPARVAGLADVVEVAAGYEFGCALGRDGRVRCFGSAPGASGEAAPIVGLEGATSVTAGGDYACALLRDRTARCWGGNLWGQLGDGTTEARAEPAPIAGLRGVTRLVLGFESACAFLNGGDVQCWGSNLQARLYGDGFSDSDQNPLPLPFPLRGLEQLAFGVPHACGVVAGGRVRCWGGPDEFGETGPPSFGPRGSGRSGDVRAPVEVAAGNMHNCALLAGEDARGEPRVRCWGSNLAGELGAPTRRDRSRAPVAVRFREAGRGDSSSP
jgi:alpha-tubulin suppressor-like RCC1 family protein